MTPVQTEYEQRMKHLFAVLDDQSQYTRIMWDETVNKYARTIERMKLILEQDGLKDHVSSGIIRDINRFVEKCKSPEFHIAIVGAIKAGKSTLINAMLGKELASIRVTPETATLTKFRASSGNHYLKISFYSDSEWAELWKSVHTAKADVFLEEYEKLDADSQKSRWIGKEPMVLHFSDDKSLQEEIAKWTSSKHATHYFVKEVEVGIADFELPEQVVFVDTPGLDDPVKYRSDITRTYIDRANAVLVCVKSDALTGGELATIYSVFANTRYNPEKVYVIGTQLDTLNRPEENWAEQQKEWLKHLRRPDCFGSITLAEKNLVGTAAYLYNLASSYSTLDQDTIDFDLEPVARKFRIRDLEENLDKLIAFSRVDQLKLKLRDEIIAKHQGILIEDLKYGYTNLKDDLMQLLLTIQAGQQELLAAVDSDIHVIREKREESLRQLQETEAEKEQLTKLLKQVRNIVTKRAEELYKSIRTMGGEGA